MKNRIKELRMVRASELKNNPRNWRIHPENQRGAISGILEEVGIASAAIAYETDTGLVLIDGHLRADVCGDAEIPVLVLDVSEREADYILATFDPVCGLAEINGHVFEDLLRGVSSGCPDVQKMLDDLLLSSGIYEGLEEDLDDSNGSDNSDNSVRCTFLIDREKWGLDIKSELQRISAKYKIDLRIKD